MPTHINTNCWHCVDKNDNDSFLIKICCSILGIPLRGELPIYLQLNEVHNEPSIGQSKYSNSIDACHQEFLFKALHNSYLANSNLGFLFKYKIARYKEKGLILARWIFALLRNSENRKKTQFKYFKAPSDYKGMTFCGYKESFLYYQLLKKPRATLTY